MRITKRQLKRIIREEACKVRTNESAINNNELYTEKARFISNAFVQLEQALEIDFGPTKEFLAGDPDLDTILGYLEEYLSSLEQFGSIDNTF